MRSGTLTFILAVGLYFLGGGALSSPTGSIIPDPQPAQTSASLPDSKVSVSPAPAAIPLSDLTSSVSPGADPTDRLRPGFRVYTDRDGLPQNTIMAMAVDHNGYFWAGTQDGAAWYNGRSWTVVNLPNQNNSNYITDILVASDQSIWFAQFDGGLCCLKDGQWTTFDTRSGLPSNQMRCLLETKSSTGTPILWAGTDGGGLAKFENGKWSVITTQDGLPSNRVWTLLETVEPSGTSILWAGTFGGGLARLVQNTWQTFDRTSGLPDNSIRDLLASVSPTGQPILWVATDSGGLAKFENDAWTVVDTHAGLPSNRVDALAETIAKNGVRTLWVGTPGGLVRSEPGKWMVYDINYGLPNNTIRSLFSFSGPAASSTLWIGTFGGLVRLEQGKWLACDTRTGLPDNGVMSLLESRNSDGSYSLWFGTFGGGLARFEKGKWTVYNAQSGLPDNIAAALLSTPGPDGTPTIWVGTNRGLARLEKNQWTVFNTKNGLPGDPVQCLMATRAADGTPVVWVGTRGGLAKFQNGQWDSSLTEGLPPLARHIECLFETTSKNGTRSLWAGTRSGGLARWENGEWTIQDARTSLGNNWVFHLMELTNAAGKRQLWAATYGSGVLQLDLDIPNAKWQALSDHQKQLKPYGVVYQMRRDIQNRIYLFTTKGIVRLTPRTPTSANPEAFDVNFFTIEDGLPASGCTEGGSLIDHQGRIWAGTTGGAAVFDPALETPTQTSRQLFIERTLINGTELDQTKLAGVPPTSIGKAPALEGISLAYSDNTIMFEYSLLSYFRESETRYQTQLVNFDDSPSEWKKEAQKEYTRLPEGHYTFKVWGKDYAGNISGPLLVSFRIRPAPWRTWWAYIAYTALILGSGYGWYSRRIRTLRLRQEEHLAHLQQLQEQRIKTLRQLLESIRIINSELDLTVVLQNIAAESANLVDGRPGGIGLVEDEQVVFKRVWHRNHWEDCLFAYPVGSGIPGRVAATGQPTVLNDLSFSPDETNSPHHHLQTCSGLINVPILSRMGNVVGVLDVRRGLDRNPFTEADCQLIESLAHQAAVAMEKAALFGELEKLYQQEQEVRQTLQDLNQMKTNFIIVTSHEMRTPLTVLKGYNEALVDGYLGPLTRTQKTSLLTCLRMVDRLMASFNDILEMLRINEGRIALRPASFDLSNLVKKVLEELEAFIEQRRLQVTVELPPELYITADPEKIELVLINIIQNAIKFTFDDGDIVIRATQNGHNEAHILIRDSGIGIDQVEIKRIFETFYTSSDPSTHTSGKYEFSARGTGLGLSIARSYIEAHGGRVWAESEGKGHGSTFHIILPVENTAKPKNEE